MPDIEGTDEGESRCADWCIDEPRGATAVADMTAVLTCEGLFTPPVPLALADRLMMSTDGGAWGTDERWSSWAVYNVLGELTQPIFPDCLAPQVDDFWLCGYRGRGVNSFAFGIVARLGPIAISQQIGYGGMYGDPERKTRRVNRASLAWASTLSALGQQAPSGPPRYVVLFSDYREYALIATTSPDVQTLTTNADAEVPSFDGWRTVIAINSCDDSERQREAFAPLLDSDNSLLALSARHLAALLGSDEEGR